MRASLDQASNEVVLRDVPWNAKDLVLSVPGARYATRTRDFRIPAAWPPLVAAVGILGTALDLGEDVVEWATALRRDLIDPANQLRTALTAPPIDHNELIGFEDLRGFQSAGVRWMDVIGSGALLDEMGLGKTVQALSLIRLVAVRDGLNQALPALAVVPNGVKWHWATMAARWCPEATPYVLDGTATKRRKVLKAATTDPTALVIVNIESVRLHSRLAPYGSVRLKQCRECDPKFGDETLNAARCHVHRKELNDVEFHTVVLDEAHRIGDPTAQQTRAIWYLMHRPQVLRRWAMTGTPIRSDPLDLWPILHAVLPREFPTKGKHVDRYALLGFDLYGGTRVIGLRPDTREEFYLAVDPYLRRMLKAVVTPQLPPKVRSVRHAELTPKQRTAYDDLAKRLVARLPAGEQETGAFYIVPGDLVSRTRLMQFAAATLAVEKPDPDDVDTWGTTMREPAPKLDVLEEILDEIGAGRPDYDGPAVLVAFEHRQLLELAAARLQRRGLSYAVIHGDVSPIDRERARQALATRSIRALLFIGKAGGTGLDLSAADTLINVQRSWSMVEESQKQDRHHRIGSEIHECVRIIDIVTRDTVEEVQIERLAQKFELLEQVTRDRQQLEAHRARLSETELAERVAELDAREAAVLGEDLMRMEGSSR